MAILEGRHGYGGRYWVSLLCGDGGGRRGGGGGWETGKPKSALVGTLYRTGVWRSRLEGWHIQVGERSYFSGCMARCRRDILVLILPLVVPCWTSSCTTWVLVHVPKLSLAWRIVLFLLPTWVTVRPQRDRTCCLGSNSVAGGSMMTGCKEMGFDDRIGGSLGKAF